MGARDERVETFVIPEAPGVRTIAHTGLSEQQLAAALVLIEKMGIKAEVVIEETTRERRNEFRRAATAYFGPQGRASLYRTRRPVRRPRRVQQRPREHRSRAHARRGPPSGDSDPEPPRVDRLGGFLTASLRLHAHLLRRSGAARAEA